MAQEAAQEDGDDFALSRMRVLLPTRRAGRELRDAFLKLAQDKPILLPRVQPIGDVDAEEIEITLSGYGIEGYDIPPAISALERKFLLAQLIQKKDVSLGLDSALVLAGDLARLIDTVHTEDLDFSGIEKIVPHTLAEHWKKSLEFLEIITIFWPKILNERGQIDPADRRNRLLKSLARMWQENPPDTPIIAAGSTGSIPSAGELLKTIAELPRGIVILPNLDKDLDDDSWNALTDTHPQATMRNLLSRMKKTRDDVAVWDESRGHLFPSSSIRSGLIRDLMRPAESFGTTDGNALSTALHGMDIIEASSPREEASVIALALREVMDDKSKTACFVTPDRTLARRVMTALHRWGIDVDDSAGGALATTRGATFLVSLLRIIEENFSPLPLLDFLKHDYQRLVDIKDVEHFERFILRGARPAEGIEGLLRRTEQKNSSTICVTALDKHLGDYQRLTHGTHGLDVFCQALLTAAETWAGGEKFLWSRAESDALSKFISSIIGYANLIPPLSLSVFGRVFRELLACENYRTDDAPHRRILILGQLESRLIARDVMILGGLNEGTWPRDAGHDPWMSRPMRRNFGLPPAERSTGLAAHDFAEHMANARVIITRSLKAEGTTTVPARWIQKLRTLLKAEGIEINWSEGNRYLSLASAMDKPLSSKPLSESAPAPCPPVAYRPRALSATSIEKWMKNPYRLYAEKILKLHLLDPVDKDTLHAERGDLVHDVLMNFVKEYSGEIPDNAKDIILALAKKKLDERDHIEPHWHYWWPRFERLVDWYLDEETKWRKEAIPWIQEERGQYSLDGTNGFVVTAKADRIDRLKTGGVAVMDYKTGALPSLYRIKNGTAPQLPIESFILKKGGYKNTLCDPQKMIYWKLSGSHAAIGEFKELKKIDMGDVLTATEDGLTHLVKKFEDENTPYLAQAGVIRYDDDRAYAHLARMAEWSNGESDENDDDGEDLE